MVLSTEKNQQMGFLAETAAALPLVGDIFDIFTGDKKAPPKAEKKPNYMPFYIAGAGLGALILIVALKK